jgi:5-methyltetrahydrofolate--homocysteine methyltransferase
VKVAPAYADTTVHVLDASRAVGVVAALLDGAQRQTLDASNREEQDRIRAVYADKVARPLRSFAEAANRAPALARNTDPAPAFLGTRLLDDVSLAALVPYIDWRFFFTAWELPGRFPGVLDDPVHGAAARELFEDAQALLAEILAQGRLEARGVYGFWPAASDGHDVVLYADETRAAEVVRFPMLRQQADKGGAQAHHCLADFVAPVGQGVADHVGAFAVTAGLHADELVAHYEADHDDYRAIMVKALADRFAEAAAEWLHERARREWYAPDERLEPAALLKERFRGIRPAFGYAACPDHSLKERLFAALGAERAGLSLTEHGAMLPAASVSGLYLAHPEARYFAVGRLGRDQVEDYARRLGRSVSDTERWLTPNLGYEPARAAARVAAGA